MVWKSKYNNYLQILDGLTGRKGKIYVICEGPAQIKGS